MSITYECTTTLTSPIWIQYKRAHWQTHSNQVNTHSIDYRRERMWVVRLHWIQYQLKLCRHTLNRNTTPYKISKTKYKIQCKTYGKKYKQEESFFIRFIATVCVVVSSVSFILIHSFCSSFCALWFRVFWTFT